MPSPFEEWPEETQQYYRYDPEEAERLLDEAGYERGADGIRFSTIYSHYEFFDLGYYQIAMDYLRQIGIDVALFDRDYPIISGINLFFAVAVMVINLLVDVLYAYLDPRVQYK